MDGLSPNQFKGVHMNDVANIEDLVTLNILLYDLDFGDGNNFGVHVDEVWRNTKTMLDCGDTIIINVI